MHPTPGLKPVYIFLKMVLMASLSLIWMILQKILLGTERRVTPHQFVHCVLTLSLTFGEFNDNSPAPVFRLVLGIPDFLE